MSRCLTCAIDGTIVPFTELGKTEEELYLETTILNRYNINIYNK
jgi:hypothetical protein